MFDGNSSERGAEPRRLLPHIALELPTTAIPADVSLRIGAAAGWRPMQLDRLRPELFRSSSLPWSWVCPGRCLVRLHRPVSLADPKADGDIPAASNSIDGFRSFN